MRESVILGKNGMFKKKVKETSEQKAYRLIVDQIKLKYRPGDFLLENDLAEEFNMSRTPVTSALRMLISQGVLQKLPKKGCFIPNVTKDDARKLFFARMTIESTAIGLASEVSTDEHIQVASSILDSAKTANSAADFLEFTYLDEKFHHTIVGIGANKYLYDAWYPIYFRCNLYTRFFDKFYTKETTLKERTLLEHGEILNAIKTHRSEEAEELVRQHINRALQFVID